MPPAATPPRRRVVLLTGVTGFVGQALLERFLREEAEVHAVVRPRRGLSGAARLDELLTADAFAAWRAEVGPAGIAAARTRLHAVEADLADDVPTLPSRLDLVIHSASSVSFDDPWDVAIRANVLGPAHLYAALAAAGATPHVIHVSTAYVGADRSLVAREESVDHDVDWRAEVEAALTLRGSLGGGAEADAELRDAGRARARALGWTDVYTMSKALGERVAEQTWAAKGHRLTVLRPTIIESALVHPYPGWIDGFKVADPLIAAFAKDRLVAFPGRPESVLDVVPVDAVVDAAMAASVVPPQDGVRYLQVGTGVSNPVRLEEFRRHMEAAIRTHPWTDRHGAPIHPRPWKFLTPEELSAWVARRVRALEVVDRGLAGLPASLTHDARSRLQAATRRLTLLRTYAGIYQPYTCSRTVYDDSRTRELLAEARELMDLDALDVTRIDWRHYVEGVHVPSLRATAERHRARRDAQATSVAPGTAGGAPTLPDTGSVGRATTPRRVGRSRRLSRDRTRRATL